MEKKILFSFRSIKIDWNDKLANDNDNGLASYFDTRQKPPLITFYLFYSPINLDCPLHGGEKEIKEQVKKMEEKYRKKIVYSAVDLWKQPDQVQKELMRGANQVFHKEGTKIEQEIFN